MSSTKLIVFFLGLVSLTIMLYFGCVAVTIPLESGVPLPPLFSREEPKLAALLVFVLSLPVALIPGAAGFCLWLFVARKQDATVEHEFVSLPQREAAVQSCLDDLIPALLARGADPAAMAEEIPGRTRDLDAMQRSRILAFLAQCSSPVPVGRAADPLAKGDARNVHGSKTWEARAVGLGLFAVGGFCFLWGMLCAFFLHAPLMRPLMAEYERILGFELQPAEKVLGSLGCFAPGLAAVLGGLALRWLSHRETSRRRRYERLVDSAGEIALEGCIRRIESLFSRQHESGLPAKGAIERITRADVICALDILDGKKRGRLLVWLHAGSFLTRLALSGVDLSGAVLSGVDLTGANLSGMDLSDAILSDARFARADLSGSSLRGADLRGTDAQGTALRRADLRQARLQRCDLRQADLRGADLEGANLWQTDLTGAQLAEARITHDQLRGAIT